MPSKSIDQLIINSPYEEPREYWKYDRESRLFNREPGRRPAGYVRATESSKAFDDPGIFVPLPLVNKIRPRVNQWRESGYMGVTGITKRLMEHWRDPEQRENRRSFLLPTGSHRNSDLANRRPRLRKNRHSCPQRRWRFPAPLLKNGHRFRQNHRHGHAYFVADPE